MSSLYDRIKRSDNPDTGPQKIRIWALLNDLALHMDGEIVDADIVARHELTPGQVVTLQSWGAALTAKSAAGWSRPELFHLLWHTLIGIERGVLTEAQANARIGV